MSHPWTTKNTLRPECPDRVGELLRLRKAYQRGILNARYASVQAWELFPQVSSDRMRTFFENEPCTASVARLCTRLNDMARRTW